MSTGRVSVPSFAVGAVPVGSRFEPRTMTGAVAYAGVGATVVSYASGVNTRVVMPAGGMLGVWIVSGPT